MVRRERQAKRRSAGRRFDVVSNGRHRPGSGLRVCAKTSAGQEACIEQNAPHPDPLPSDGRGNSQIRLLHLLQRLDMPTDAEHDSPSPIRYVFSVAQPSRLRVKRASSPYSLAWRRDAARTRRRGRLRYSSLRSALNTCTIRWERAGVRVTVPQNRKLFLHES
jgi:hypothetical protein